MEACAQGRSGCLSLVEGLFRQVKKVRYELIPNKSKKNE